jgi:hypothetical protein
MATLSPTPKMQFFDNAGNLLAGGKLYTYAAGTSTPIATYTSSSGSIANTNPIILDVRGEANIWLGGVSYKFELKDSTDSLIWTVDNISTYESFKDALASSSGSNLVGFIQSGTGAVAQTVQSKLRQKCNAADYGFATTNTGAQNATALVNALNAFDIVEMSAGTYTINPFNIPENKSLVGQGSTNTFLQTSTSSNAITFDGTYNTQLQGFTLNQTGSVQGTGLYLLDQYFVTMIDVTTNGFEYGLKAFQSLYHYLRECKFEGGKYGAYYGGTGTVWNVDWFNNVLTFENCRFNSNTIIGTYIKGCEVVFIDCDWSSMTTNGAIGLKVEGVNQGYPAHGIQIIQPYAELTDIVFSFSYAFVEINGGFVQGGSAAGASAATSIIDVANYSSVWWKGRPRDSDYWDYGYRVTNNSPLIFDRGFTQSVRAANTVDGTSSVTYTVSETVPGSIASAVASYNTLGRKINYTDGLTSVPTATPTTTGVLTDKTSSGDVYLVSASGWNATGVQLVGGLAFVTIYNDGTTKRAASVSLAGTNFTWSSIATDGTITFQQTSGNSITVFFNAVKMN